MDSVRCLSCLLWALLLTGIWLQENICLLYRFRSAALYALWNARIKAGDDVAALKAARAATSVPSPFLVSFSQRHSVPVSSRSVDGAASLRVTVRVSPRYLSIDDFVARRILARCVSSVIRAIGDRTLTGVLSESAGMQGDTGRSAGATGDRGRRPRPSTSA